MPNLRRRSWSSGGESPSRRVVHFCQKKELVFSGGPTMRESCAVRIQAVKVNESMSQRVTSPRVGCNCHRIRSRTEISKAFSEAHIEVGTLGFDFVKGAETKKYSKMCQVCRCGWQGASLPAVCPCQGSHLRHFQEREGETLLIHYGLNCRWPHLVVSVSDQKHSECVTNFCRILRNWLKSLRNSKMIMGEIVCNLV